MDSAVGQIRSEYTLLFVAWVLFIVRYTQFVAWVLSVIRYTQFIVEEERLMDSDLGSFLIPSELSSLFWRAYRFVPQQDQHSSHLQPQ